MTPEDIFRNESINFEQQTINGINCSVGYIKNFKWSWFATQLNTFIIIGKTDQKIERQTIEDFSNSCFEYSLQNHEGWAIGLQSGVASIAILQGKDIEDEAKDFCEKLSKKHWSAFEIPVLYDINKNRAIRFIKKPLWGIIYFPYLAKTIDSITSKF
jgi:hypothetical protein